MVDQYSSPPSPYPDSLTSPIEADPTRENHSLPSITSPAVLASTPRVPMWLWILSVGSIVLLLGLGVTVLITNQPNTGPYPSPDPQIQASTDTEDWIPPEKTLNPNADPSQSVVQYRVEGEGKAVSITYLADNGVLTTLLDVGLPWSMQARMAASAAAAASVTVIGINTSLDCQLAVDGQEVDHQSGSVMTICSAAKHQ